jgi:hypothetical protein
MKRKMEASGFDFLFDNTSFNFEKPRTCALLSTSTNIPSTTKPAYFTREYILQGPYDDIKDSESLQKLQVTIDKLMLINYIKNIHLIPESPHHPNVIWYVYEYGGHLPHPYIEKYEWKPDQRLVCQIVVAILLKKVLSIGGGWENILGSSGKVYIHCLDDTSVWDLKECTSSCSQTFRVYMTKHIDSVAEYITFMTQKIESVWTDDDVNSWKQEVKKMNIPLHFNNLEKFGWPVKEDQRVMIRYSQNHYARNEDKTLVPGTIMNSSNNKLHVPLDYTSNGYIFRNVSIDPNFRYLLGSSSHVDMIRSL